MQTEATLLLRRRDVAQLLTLRDCIDAVEEVFLAQGRGEVPPARILGLHGPGGGLHIKAAFMPGARSYFVAKLNTNFPDNIQSLGRPTVQGLIGVFDAENGRPLAILDSIEITIKRTAAASAVAARFLARPAARVATICGCGVQGHAHIEALRAVIPLRKIHLFDTQEAAARELAKRLADEADVEVDVVSDLARAIRESDVCVTCTTARKFFVRQEDVRPGTFVAAVGADSENKQEIDPALMASANVVADSAEQSCAIGDFHHAIGAGLTTSESIYAELSAVVAGLKPGRTDDAEIFIFDSTGVAIEDAVAAAAVYEKAVRANIGSEFAFQ